MHLEIYVPVVTFRIGSLSEKRLLLYTTSPRLLIALSVTVGLWSEDLPLPRSRHPGDSSESRVEVQNKSSPGASGPSLVLSARLDLTKGKNGSEGEGT